jgi:hypothetical protein
MTRVYIRGPAALHIARYRVARFGPVPVPVPGRRRASRWRVTAWSACLTIFVGALI